MEIGRKAVAPVPEVLSSRQQFSAVLGAEALHLLLYPFAITVRVRSSLSFDDDFYRDT